MPKFDLLIRGGIIVRERGIERADIAASGERIVEVAPEIAGDARETIDATGLHVFPGVIDPHVHFNEPGRTEWEGFATGSSALAAGGGTLFFDMPLNSSPPVLDGASFDLKLQAAKKSSYTDFALWGGLTPGNLDRMDELAERGAVGFKAFMCDSGIDDFPMADDYTLLRGMQIAAKLGLIVALHAENHAITAGLSGAAVRAGRVTIDDFLASRPVVAEVEAIRRATCLAEETGCSIHIVHVSSHDGECAAETARSKADVSHETCPHYLLLCDADARSIGALAKCAPPLRGAADCKLLCQALNNGRIEFVASDHSPSPPAMKNDASFFRIWGGIAGVQSTLAALLTLDFTAESAARLTATSAARRFAIANKGAIAEGFDADLAFVDLSSTYVLRHDDLLDRHKLSPYVGRTFRGKIVRTILRGRTILENGKMTESPGGRFVRPKRA